MARNTNRRRITRRRAKRKKYMTGGSSIDAVSSGAGDGNRQVIASSTWVNPNATALLGDPTADVRMDEFKEIISGLQSTVLLRIDEKFTEMEGRLIAAIAAIADRPGANEAGASANEAGSVGSLKWTGGPARRHRPSQQRLGCWRASPLTLHT